MLPYLEIHREFLILTLGYGGIGLLGLALALGARRWYLGWSEGGAQGKPEDHERFPDGVEEGHGKVPLFLALLYVVLALWALLYIAAHAWWGMEFGG